MTRENLPRFDLYGELEVSPFASMGIVEAAYRSLVKQHHPDVAAGDDGRIKRLNLAREWLTDPVRRYRYDTETDRGRHIPPTARSTTTRSAARAKSAGSGPSTSARSASAEPSFGIHADEVRQFLAELRSLDLARAQRVWNGRAVAHAKGYTQALRAAASAARIEREAEWQFAREAASVIVRGKLGDSTLAEQVAEVLSDVAGVIAIRDLLSPAELTILMLPWTWRGTVRLPAVQPAPAAQPAAQAPVIKPAKPAAAPPVSVPPPAKVVPPPARPDAAPTAATHAPSAPESGPLPPPMAPRPVQPPPVLATPPTPQPPRALPATPPRPFVAAARPAATPPLWPTAAPEPRAQPPVDPGIIRARLAAATAAAGAAPAVTAAATATPVATMPPRPVARTPAADRPTTITRPRPSQAASRRIVSFPTLVAAVSIVLLIGAAVALLNGAKQDQAVAGATDAPTGTLPGIALGSEPPATLDPSTAETGQPIASPGSTVTGGGAVITPRPKSTPRPPRQTPSPTVPPGATPTPAPTPTPGPKCTVPNLVGQQTSNIQPLWDGAGFTGPISYNPQIPPQFRIAWQSLPADSSAPCSSGITVKRIAP